MGPGVGGGGEHNHLCGTSQYTTSMDINNTRYKRESLIQNHMRYDCALSLLERRE